MLNQPRHRHGGFSLVELMVGVTVGLVVLAGVTTFFANYLSTNRELIQAARLDQEMRTAMDILVRDLKRAGYKRDIHLDILNLTEDPTSRAATMPLLDNGQVVITDSTIEFWYDENSDDTLDTGALTEKHGYRLSDDTLQRSVGDSGWQDITDPAITQITGLTFTRTYRCIDIDGSDPTTGGPATCGGSPVAPESSDDGAYFVTEIGVELTGNLVADGAISRTLNERVRIRADIYRDDGSTGSFTY